MRMPFLRMEFSVRSYMTTFLSSLSFWVLNSSTCILISKMMIPYPCKLWEGPRSRKMLKKWTGQLPKLELLFQPRFPLPSWWHQKKLDLLAEIEFVGMLVEEQQIESGLMNDCLPLPNQKRLPGSWLADGPVWGLAAHSALRLQTHSAQTLALSFSSMASSDDWTGLPKGVSLFVWRR